jgi:hypothetical protein
VAGTEYGRLNTGGSITRGNNGNGVLPTLTGKNVGNKNIAPNERKYNTCGLWSVRIVSASALAA